MKTITITPALLARLKKHKTVKVFVPEDDAAFDTPHWLTLLAPAPTRKAKKTKSRSQKRGS